MLWIVSNKSYYIWAGILALTALILMWIPLFNLLGFEFSVVISVIVGLAAAHVAITAVNGTRAETPYMQRVIARDSSIDIVIRIYVRALCAGLLLLVLPLIIILLNATRVKNCDFAEGFAFFGLIPVITCAYSTAAGMFFGFWLSSRRRAYFAYLGYIVASILWGLYNIIFHPPIFGYNSVVGYFPGPIYDEQVSITGTLILARVTTIIVTCIFLALTASALDIKTLRFRFRHFHRYELSFNPLLTRTCLTIFTIVFAFIFIHQGDLGLRLSRSDIQDKLGGKYETEHFSIYYEKGTEVERHIELIAQDHEFRYHQLTQFFQLHPQKKVGSYVYTSAEQKKRLMGAKHTSIEDPINREIHINYSAKYPHPVLKHELAHVFAGEVHPIWKVSLKMGLHEGIAVAAEWDEGHLTAHQWSKAMRTLKVARPVEKIMSAWGFWTQSSSRSYTLAGSFVRYLVDTYGIEKFKRVFPTGNFKKHYGKELKKLVREWEQFLETVPLSPSDMTVAEYRFKAPSIFEKPCAHERAELSSKAWDYYSRSNYDAAIKLFQQIYDDDKNNPRPLRGILYSYYYSKNYNKTLEIVDQIIKHRNASVFFIAMAKNFHGNTLWQKGKPTEAQKLFIDIYNLHVSNSYDRELSAKLESLRYPDEADKMRDVLISKESGSIRILTLKEIVEQQPDFSLAYYLIGRQLHFEEKYAHSNEYLGRAETWGLSDDSLTFENYRLLGVNYFHIGKYEQAIQYFNKIAISERPMGEINRAKDWIERLRITSYELRITN